MRAAGSSLITYLASLGESAQKPLVADLYTIALADGVTVLYWSTCEVPLVVGGHTFLGTGSAVPTITRGRMRMAAGIEVSTLEVTLGVGTNGTQPAIGGFSLPLAASKGLLDGASVNIDRLFMGPNGWGDISLGTMAWFYGQVADIEPSSTNVKLTIESGLAKLAVRQIPRRVFQHLCPYDLYEPACGATKSPVAGTVISGNGAPSVVVSDASATGHWNGGTVSFADGSVRSIVTSTLGGGHNTLLLAVSLSVAPAASSAVSLLLGCDKQWSTCNTTFGRAAYFGGFPFVPTPNTLRVL